MSGSRFELFSMLIEAAIHGIGIALVPSVLVENELRCGLLVEVGGQFSWSALSYYLVYPQGKADVGPLVSFRTWLEEQAALHRADAGLAILSR